MTNLIGRSMLVEIGGSYSLHVIYYKRSNAWSVNIYLKEYMVDDLHSILSADFICDDNIERKIMNYIENHLIKNNYINYYINRLEYYDKCFSIGNSILERGESY